MKHLGENQGAEQAIMLPVLTDPWVAISRFPDKFSEVFGDGLPRRRVMRIRPSIDRPSVETGFNTQDFENSTTKKCVTFVAESYHFGFRSCRKLLKDGSSVRELDPRRWA